MGWKIRFKKGRVGKNIFFSKNSMGLFVVSRGWEKFWGGIVWEWVFFSVCMFLIFGRVRIVGYEGGFGFG